MKFDLNRSIERKLQSFQKAQKALVDEILKQQRACKHKVVWEIPWKDLEYAGCLNARRMCVACRYEEEGSHWSGGSTWSRNHKDGMPFFEPVLKDVQFAPQITRDSFYAKRLPVGVPDYVELDFAEEARREAAKYPFVACPSKSRRLDPLEGCGDCGGCGSHLSIENPAVVAAN
jgi:hypothetical protein